MKKQSTSAYDSSIREIDRMIDEGLGGGTVDLKYTEAHLKLKEKYQDFHSAQPVETSKQGGDIT